MDKGRYELDAQITRMERLTELTRQAAPGCADVMREGLERSIAAGKSPEGETWAPRKDDGQKPLQGAVKALTVVPVLSTVFVRLKGPEARHHLGRAKGGVVRGIIPAKGLPQPMVRAFREVLVETFKRITESR